MPTNIIYCKKCDPPKVISAGRGQLPASHKVFKKKKLITHRKKDIALIEVKIDPMLPGETPQNYLDRMQETYQEKLK